MTYFTVFGRLLGDDDDSCLVTKAKDDNDAIELIGPTFVERASKALTDYMDGPDALVRDLLAELRQQLAATGPKEEGK